MPPVATQPPTAPELPPGEAQHVTNSDDPCAAAMQEDNDHPPSPSATGPPPPPPPAPPTKSPLRPLRLRPLALRLPLANAARSANVLLSPLEPRPCFPGGRSAAAADAANEAAAAEADLDQKRTDPSRPPDAHADGGRPAVVDGISAQHEIQSVCLVALGENKMRERKEMRIERKEKGVHTYIHTKTQVRPL